LDVHKYDKEREDDKKRSNVEGLGYIVFIWEWFYTIYNINL